MEKTTEQTGRPAGHPGYCTCGACTDWRLANGLPSNRQPKPAAVAAPRPPTEWARPAAPPPDYQAITADYARRIHWWVRLFGIVWIVIPVALTLFVIVYMITAAARVSGS